jgi:hypothetical protein
MGNALRQHESTSQMVHITCLTTVGTEVQGRKSSGLAEPVQAVQVRVEVVKVVGVRRVFVQVPLRWRRVFAEDSCLGLTFVIHTVNTNAVFQKFVKLRVLAWIESYFKERLEDIYEAQVSGGFNRKPAVRAYFRPSVGSLLLDCLTCKWNTNEVSAQESGHCPI